MKFLLSLIIFLITGISSHAQINADAILGKWMSEDKNLEVEIFKAGSEYKATVVWFDDTDDKRHPMNERCDKKNPDKSLCTRKIIGMEVMQGLVYNEGDKEWQGGRIYDASSGKDWNAKAWLKDGFLKVRGYWHFEFLGETMRLKKIANK
jgi:uncharacterized protein (DUF2147 family)